MSIQISAEIEVRLTEEARRLGISVEALLARLVLPSLGVDTLSEFWPVWARHCNSCVV